MDRPEYVKIKINDIPTEFIDEYNLQAVTHNGWVYFDIVRGCHALPQSGKLSNNLLITHLNRAGCFEAATNPGLWKQTWSSIRFCVIIDEFGI